MVVPDEVATFGTQVVAQLVEILGDDSFGAYFVGSIALGGYVAGESDIDIVVVTEASLLDDLKRRVADGVLDSVKDCPARGLEFTLYWREVTVRPPQEADFEVNVNGGPRMARTVNLDSRAQPRFWYVLDRAVAYKSGVTIVGPLPREVFAEVPRQTLLDVMAESMRWHRQHEKATLYSVLNASRAWRFAAENVLGSKLEGAAWARSRWSRPEMIDAAVGLRHGRAAELKPDDVDEFLAYVEGILRTIDRGNDR